MDQLRQPPSGAIVDSRPMDRPKNWRRDLDVMPTTGRVSASALSVELAGRELEKLRHALRQAWAEIAELRMLADHDTLTGLANRRRLMLAIDVAIENCKHHGKPAALVFIDMDRLKRLNDHCGHQAGDAAISHVARTISDSLPDGLAARLGGDEFALVIAGADRDEAHRRASAIAARIAASSFQWQGRCYRLSVSFGVTAIDPNATAKMLLARADTAMYADKRERQAARSAR